MAVRAVRAASWPPFPAHPQEAVEYGLIDAVVTSPHVAMQTP